MNKHQDRGHVATLQDPNLPQQPVHKGTYVRLREPHIMPVMGGFVGPGLLEGDTTPPNANPRPLVRSCLTPITPCDLSPLQVVSLLCAQRADG